MENFASRIHLSAQTVLILATFVSALLLGPLISILHFGARELAILVLVILTAFLILAGSERVIKLGFVLWILTFAFGWRTLYFTANLNIHPSEVLIVLLLFLVIARAVTHRDRVDFSLPIPITLFMLFGFLGVITAILNGNAPDVIVEEFKPFLALIPIFYVVKWVVNTRQDWERAIFLTILVAAYLGGLGLMDYFTPDASRALAGNSTIPTLYTDLDYGAGQFARVGFIFYGNFSAGFVIFTFLGFTIYHLLNNPGRKVFKTTIFLALLFVQLAGIYLSGYRGLWYAMGVFLLAFALIQRRAWIILGASLLGLPLLPVDFFNRFQSIFNPTYADSSQFQRLQRFLDAVELARQSPIVGVGWGGSGYVHSDLAQIGANLGLPALVVFLVWILGLAWQISRIAKRKDWIGGYAGALFAGICGIIALFAVEGLIVFVQLLVPVWFVLMMSYKLFDLASRQQTEPVSSPQPRPVRLETGG